MAKLVTIYGGSGFLGRQIASVMARQGWRVRVACRRPNEALFVRTYGAVGQVMPVPCNIRDDRSVEAAMTDADAVINCVGLMVREGRNTFDAVQSEGAGRIARIAAALGVPHVVHVSALGADAGSRSAYARSKAAGEQAVLAARLDAVILRPSVIFGPGDSFFTRFGKMTRGGPVMAITGGRTRVQPVFVDDVARAAALAADGAVPPGIYPLGGPEVMTMRGVIDLVLAQVNRRRAVVNLPFWAAGLVGGALDLGQTVTGGLMTNRILTRDQVRLLRHDNVTPTQDTGFAPFGITPVAPAAILPTYMWPYRPSGQYDEIKASAKHLRATR